MSTRAGEMRERCLRWLDESLRGWEYVEGAPPPGGRLRATRVALGMTTRQLAARLWVSKTAVTTAERGEASGAISLATLRVYAAGLECRVVYIIIPAAGSLRDTLINRLEAHYRATHEVVDEQELAALARRVALRNRSSLWGAKIRR